MWVWHSPFHRIQAQQPHSIPQDLSGAIIQCHARQFEFWLAADYSESVISRAQDMCHLEQICQDGRGLEGLHRVGHHVGPLRKHADEVGGVLFGEQVEVCGPQCREVDLCLARDGAEASVGVLEVRAGVAFEGSHVVQVELVAVDSGTR